MGQPLQNLDHAAGLEYLEKVLRINQKTYPCNHPDLAAAYNNIGTIDTDMGEHHKALRCLENAIRTEETVRGFDHPDLAGCYLRRAKVR